MFFVAHLTRVLIIHKHLHSSQEAKKYQKTKTARADRKKSDIVFGLNFGTIQVFSFFFVDVANFWQYLIWTRTTVIRRCNMIFGWFSSVSFSMRFFVIWYFFAPLYLLTCGKLEVFDFYVSDIFLYLSFSIRRLIYRLQFTYFS